jgi:hypothetical protein
MNKEQNPGREGWTDEFWNADEIVGRIYLYGSGYLLGMQGHVAPGPYRDRRDLVPLRHTTGTRDYVLVHPYILLPTFAAPRSLLDTRVSGIGNGYRQPPSPETCRRERIGDGQAWYYREDRTLVLWECMLFPRHRKPSPDQDPNLHVLWQGFERFLRQRFSAARRMVTPRDEPEYDAGEWEHFLTRRGFRPLEGGAYGKDLERDS